MLTTKGITEARALAAEDLRLRVSGKSYPDMTGRLKPANARGEYQRLLIAVVEAAKSRNRAGASMRCLAGTLDFDPEHEASFLAWDSLLEIAVEELQHFEVKHGTGEK